MITAIPLPVCLYMVVRNWALRFVITECTFWILTLYASVIMLAPFLLEELLARNSRKCCQVFCFMTPIALEYVFDVCVFQHTATGTFRTDAARQRIDQIFFNEMVFWPLLLSFFSGASFSTARVVY